MIYLNRKGGSMNLRLLSLCLLLSLFQASCQNDSYVSAVTGVSPPLTLEYEIVNMVTLNIGDGVQIRATIERLKEPANISPRRKPVSKLVLRNLSTDRVTYEEEAGDSSLYDPNVWVDRGPALILTSKGELANSIRVFEVTQSTARVVLSDSYRAAFIVMPNDKLGGDTGFLLIDSESGADPLQIRRYQHNDIKQEYTLTGTTDFAKFIDSVKTQFSKVTK
jgi:hypothetical protein